LASRDPAQFGHSGLDLTLRYGLDREKGPPPVTQQLVKVGLQQPEQSLRVDAWPGFLIEDVTHSPLGHAGHSADSGLRNIQQLEKCAEPCHIGLCGIVPCGPCGRLRGEAYAMSRGLGLSPLVRAFRTVPNVFHEHSLPGSTGILVSLLVSCALPSLSLAQHR